MLRTANEEIASLRARLAGDGDRSEPVPLHDAATRAGRPI
jgi:hypothetical protein